MKRQLYEQYKEEINLLSEELNPEEKYVLGFLKGFDRRKMKEWQKQGLFD